MGAVTFEDEPSAATASKAVTFDDAPPVLSKGEALRKALVEQEKARELPTHRALASTALDEFTLGATRPISAALAATTEGITGAHPDTSWGERYAAMKAALDARAEKAKAGLGGAGPSVAAVSSLPANYLLGGGGKLMGLGETVLKSMVPASIEGVSKAAPGEELKGGLKSAGTAAGATTVLGSAARSLNPAEWRGAAAEAKAARGATPEQVKAEASALYKRMDEAGVRYDASQTADLYKALHDLRNTGKYSEAANPGLKDHFNNLMSASRNEMSYTELQNLRSAVAEQARGSDASTRRAAGELLGPIDKLIRSQPTVNPKGIDMGAAHPEASRLWKAQALADDTGWIADKAARKQSWKSGVNPDEATRGNFARVEERITKPGAYDPFDDKGREILSKIIRGDKIQNVEAGAGDFMKRNAPWIGGAAGALASGAGMVSGGPGGIAAAAAGLPVKFAASGAGSALERMAANRGQQNVNELLRHITGSPTPTPGAAISREDLAKIMFGRDLARLSAQQVGD
jgi:hypothetical protein